MQKLSVVIICKNSAGVIANTLASFEGLTDDIIVYDNGSTDSTKLLVEQQGARLHEGEWLGFGKTKNKANTLAKYDWILSLDADEAIDEQLKNSLLMLNLEDTSRVYDLKFKNFLGDKWIKYGAWKNDSHIRLFNRKRISWNNAAVHESLILSEDIKIERVKGFVIHKTADSVEEFELKMRNYAKLNAAKYFEQGKKSGRIKMFAAAIFSFLKNYIIKFGFADGKTGYACARIIALYTFLKYRELNKLNNKK